MIFLIIIPCNTANDYPNKTVLLRERERHTARHVSSTPYAILSWGKPHPWLGGTPSLAGGYSVLGYPLHLGLGYSLSGTGVPRRKGPGTSQRES